MAHRTMRTFKREITDTVELNKVLESNYICRIAFYDVDEDYPYIVPINYGYEYNQKTGKLNLYFHSAIEGRKIDLINQNNRVGFDIDENWGLKQTAIACRWGLNYNSIIGVGIISIIPEEDQQEKKRCLDIIMNKHGRYHNLDYDPEAFKRTRVLKLEVEKFTGKRYRDRTGNE